MTDIVDKLRALEAWIRNPTGDPFNMNTDLFDEAANEIERLRAGGCARDQGLTQYCAEAAEKEARIRRMALDHIAETGQLIDRIGELSAENERLQTDLHLAISSDSEYCATLQRINADLLDAPTIDIDVVVPDRDYSTMTPKDCYEAGLLDGVYQARVAIKAAARAAIAAQPAGDKT